MLTLLMLLFMQTPQPEYHVVVFAYESKLGGLKPAQTHVFASWTKSIDKKVVENIDINWGPKDDVGRVTNQIVEGDVKSIKVSIEVFKDKKYKIWTLKTNEQFFEDAKKQQQKLKNAKYKALDKKTRPEAINCIHACSDVCGYLETGLKSGISAGQSIVDFFLLNGKVSTEKDSWVLQSLLEKCDVKLPEDDI